MAGYAGFFFQNIILFSTIVPFEYNILYKTGPVH